METKHTTYDFQIGMKVKDLSNIQGVVIENPSDTIFIRVDFGNGNWRDLKPEQLTIVADTKQPDYSGITKGDWIINDPFQNDGKIYISNGENVIAYIAKNPSVNIDDEAEANAQAIASLPNLIKENEELKARCDTYKKDYESMVKEVWRLSGENSKMKELIADRIKELEG